MRRGLALTLVCLLALSCATSGIAAPGTTDNPATISWKPPRQEKDSISIKGSLRTPFGLFTLTWRITSSGTVTLADEEPSGTGEMLIYDKTPIYPWYPGGEKVYLFRIRMPLLGSTIPVSMHLVAVVKQSELFTGLSTIAATRSSGQLKENASLPESIPPEAIANWNTSGLIWKLSEKGQTRLYSSDLSGAQIEVFPWMMDATPDVPSTSLVFEIATHTAEDIYLKFLTCRAKVDTAQMLSSR